MTGLRWGIGRSPGCTALLDRDDDMAEDGDWALLGDSRLPLLPLGDGASLGPGGRVGVSEVEAKLGWILRFWGGRCWRVDVEGLQQPRGAAVVSGFGAPKVLRL